MKTIEISDEMHAKLIALATEMTTQDMRCTKMPHMFQVRTRMEVPAYEGCGEEIWVNMDGDTLRNDDEIRELIKEELYQNDESFYIGNFETNADLDKALNEKVGKMSSDDLDEYIDTHNNDDWRRVAVTTEDKYVNTFFTAKACQEHIDSNHYHYNKPDVYLNSAWRNPEMELVSEFLCNLVGKSNHK